MSGLTKDQLKNELITHGVELPAASARKEEYLRLYNKHVAPIEQSKGEFSSDDDDELPVLVAKENNEVTMEQSLVVDGLDITTLDDDELRSRLQDLGGQLGPIVDSTRKIYQKQLMVLMGGDIVDSPTYNGDVDEEEYSDSEEAEEVQEEVVTTIEEDAVSSPPPSDITSIRKRVLLSSSGESPRDEVVYDPHKHTPSPRRSLRSVTSTSTTYETAIIRNTMNNGRSGLMNSSAPVTTTEEEEEQDTKSKKSLLVRLIVKLLFLGLIIALILYIYKNDPSESPFKAVEQLARQALEAAVGEEAGVDEEVVAENAEASAPPPAPPQETPVH